MRRVIILGLAAGLVVLGARPLVTGGSSGGTVAPYDPTVTVAASKVVSSGGSPLDWHGRASVRRRADGVLVLTYRRGSKHQVNDGALYIRFSDDNGATWTAENTRLGGGAVGGFPMNPPTLSAGEDAGEPWKYVAPNGDLILHMWRVDYGVTANGTYQSRSTDGGESWTAATLVDFAGITDDLKVFATDDHFVFDRVIYAGVRIYNDVTPTDPKAALVKSADNGTTWEYISDITSGNSHEVGIEYVGNDTIVAMIRDTSHTQSFRRVSTDMGATWGTLVDVTSTVGIAARQRAYTLAHLRGEAGWWKDPNLIMVGFVHQTSGSSHPRRSAVWFSPDRGTTWDGPHYIDVSIEDGGYGDVFWNGTGYTVVSYHGTLESADLKQYDLTVTFR